MFNNIIYVHVRGHKSTQGTDFRNEIIDECQKLAAGNTCNKECIKIDYDAISIQINHSGTMDNLTKMEITNFLLTLGEEFSQVDIPAMGVACSGKAAIFGCSRNECQHLPAKYKSSEMLVLNCPVKLQCTNHAKNRSYSIS